MFKSYIEPKEAAEAKRKLPKLMVEGLFLGGGGLGVLALIFEIAADAFSVAAYQTLLAIHGAEGHHRIAIYAFMLLSVLLFLGIVPAYKAGAYLRPNAGGSGPLVEAIGPPKMRWLSWIGSSLFFVDAILTIIISSISAADATMLLYPELAPYRIALAELFAFAIMAVLVLLGPKRAVPLFLIGGGAFTLFTLGALGMVAAAAAGGNDWAFLAEGIVSRLEANGVVEHVVRAQQDIPVLGTMLFFKLFFSSMSSAMLGFSGYEVIPASGKHAARPKWKVINTALTLAAVFLIGTGVVQLFAASAWSIPATEGYSTLLIEYEIVGAQWLSGEEPITADSITATPEDFAMAEEMQHDSHSEEGHGLSTEEVAKNLAVGRELQSRMDGTTGATFLLIAGVLLAIILLLAQGGGYVGGSAVAANAARLGRLPARFDDDRIGIAVIWGISAILIPIIREVVVVESYYAFGFVSAFVITSTTVYLVTDEALRHRGIEPGSAEAKSLKFAGFRGMLASYFMAIVLITQKTDALFAIAIAGAIITVIQVYYSRGGFAKPEFEPTTHDFTSGTENFEYAMGLERAHDEARQRGTVDAIKALLADGVMLNKFNVSPGHIERLICHLHNIDPELFHHDDGHHDERIEEPNSDLEDTYLAAYNEREHLARHIEDYSHYGIFMFIHNYHLNWSAPEHGRDATVVQKAMLDILFPLTEHDEIWDEYQAFEPQRMPEAIWQFSRERYLWAKDQWPNLSDRITTVWTLQDFGLLSRDIDVQTVVSAAGGQKRMIVQIPTSKPDQSKTFEQDGEDEEDADE